MLRQPTKSTLFPYTTLFRSNVERLELQGSVSTGTGNNDANTLIGNDAANVLDGSGGADLMIGRGGEDRKSTRLNSSHPFKSYAVFCVKKKTFIDYTLTANVE